MKAKKTKPPKKNMISARYLWGYASDTVNGCRLDTVIESLKKLADSYGEDALFCVEESDCSESQSVIYIEHQRLETDTEFTKRLLREQKKKEREEALQKKVEELEYQQYLELKEKFENKEKT